MHYNNKEERYRLHHHYLHQTKNPTQNQGKSGGGISAEGGDIHQKRRLYLHCQPTISTKRLEIDSQIAKSGCSGEGGDFYTVSSKDSHKQADAKFELYE